jgi:peptide/nickel transport system ATP-binding protein
VHPYAQALLAGMPTLEARKKTYLPIRGEMPSPLDPPPGCHFHPRCPHATARCRAEVPALRELGAGHSAACHLVG